MVVELAVLSNVEVTLIPTELATISHSALEVDTTHTRLVLLSESSTGMSNFLFGGRPTGFFG